MSSAPLLSAASALIETQLELTALWRTEARHHRLMYLAAFKAGADAAGQLERERELRLSIVTMQRDQMREVRRVMWLACMLAVVARSGR